MESPDPQVRELCDAGDRHGAATVLIRGYGPEIYGFLIALHRADQEADDVFALWSERIWRGLERFAWQCSLRTWCYAIARNASSNFRRDARVRERRALPLPESSALQQLQQQVRSETRPYQRTEVKDKLAQIRESLSEEDQLLLVLRVDKQLAWRDLAQVVLDDGEPIEAARLGREAQRLRKRFQLLKNRLVELGRSHGILSDE
ncbi:MAG: RNA polymerase sigma factor [Kofleriaceae bacterium]